MAANASSRMADQETVADGLPAPADLRRAEPQRGMALLTWDPACRRSVSMARELGVPLQTIHYLWYRRPWVAPLKYALQTVATLRWLHSNRPGLVVVQSPPPFAAWVVWLYCRLSSASFVIDAHTGLFLEPKWRAFLPLSRLLMRSAALTLVTNEALRVRVQAWGANAFVLPDPLPDLVQSDDRFPLDPTHFNVAAVFSFYEDEPVEEVLSVRHLPPDMRVYVTGDSTRVPERLRRRLSPQVTLTGFLPRARFDSLILSCDAVVVLCTRPHTLLCGAYESVAAGKPLLTSHSDAMRAYFRGGTLFTDNSTLGIESGLADLYQRRAALEAEMRDARRRLRAGWRRTCVQFLIELERLGISSDDLPRLV